MAEDKKSKTIKNVTEIPNASVKIEVEEKEEPAEKTPPDQTADNTSEGENSKQTDEINDPETSDGFGWKKLILTVLIVVPIGFFAFGGFLYFSKNFNANFLKKEPEKSIKLPEISPTPTEVEVNKEEYEIEVQNGSGIAGEGARVKEILEEAGFKVSSVGNADNSDYTETIITVNKQIKGGFIDELTKVLEERGTVGKIEKFDEGEEGDVLVVIGSDLKATPTPEE